MRPSLVLALSRRTKLIFVAFVLFMAIVATNLVSGYWNRPTAHTVYAASTDYFLYVDGIKGESKDKAHMDEIVLTGFSLGATNSGTGLTGTGGGKPQPSPLQVTKLVDISSAPLLGDLYTGKHIKKVVLTARKSGAKGPVEFLVITLEDVVVSSYNVQGDNSSYPNEKLDLNYAQIIVKYTSEKGDGSPGPGSNTTYDFKGNKAG